MGNNLSQSCDGRWAFISWGGPSDRHGKPHKFFVYFGRQHKNQLICSFSRALLKPLHIVNVLETRLLTPLKLALLAAPVRYNCLYSLE
jgi:hypothetical protein